MIEPQPAKVSTPKNGQPILAVGIILKEDQKSCIRIRTPKNGYIAEDSRSQFELDSDKEYLIEASADTLRIRAGNTLCLESKSFPLHISASESSKSTIAPQTGIRVDSVVAGRHFHWRKEVVQTLPGELELYADGNDLILVNRVAFEDYISCVISSEMAAACPKEFMKAQAVAARSWALAFLSHKHLGTPYTICNDDDCQRYQGTTWLAPHVVEAVRECCGDFLQTEDGFVCAAYYAKSCGGMSEKAKNVFGFDVTGLGECVDSPGEEEVLLNNDASFKSWLKQEHSAHKDIFCSPATIEESTLKQYLGAVDEKGRYYRWQYSISHDDLANIIRERRNLPELKEIVELIPGPRGVSGRILNLTIRYQTKDGQIQTHLVPDTYDIRRTLHQSFLFSSAFELEYRRNAAGKIESIDFYGAGWGHGVGFCQIGALGMAIKGYNYKDILLHYFPKTKVVKAYG